MKVLGYGWIKNGETLKHALAKYGMSQEPRRGPKPKKPVETLKLAKSENEVRKEIKERINQKMNRRSMKPKIIRVVLEEIEA